MLWTLETLPAAIDLWQDGKTEDTDFWSEDDGYEENIETGGAQGSMEPREGVTSGNSTGESAAKGLLPEKKETVFELMVNGKPIALSGKEEYIYVDVFEAIDFDLTRPRGKSIVTTLNGRPAQYMEPLHAGDVLEVYWKS